jgi:anti-anti-sigma factor
MNTTNSSRHTKGYEKMNKLIDVETKDSILFLRPKDRELGMQHAEAVKRTTREWLEKGIKGVVINFSLTEYMSSIFLSAIIELLKDLGEKKIKLALAELSPKIVEVLKATKLDSVFLIFDGSYEAHKALLQTC